MQVRGHRDASVRRAKTPCPDMPFCVLMLSLRIAKTAHILLPTQGAGVNPAPGLACEKERRPLAGRAPNDSQHL